MSRAWWVALAPVVIAGAVAGGLLAAGADTWLVLSARLSLTIALAGAVISGAWLGALALRSRASRREAAVEARVRDEERQARHRFMRRLDHELKNPVTAIRTALAAQPTRDPAMGVVSTQARRLSTLVGDLAKLADLDTRELEREPVDLRDVVDEAVDVLPPTDRRISVEFPQVPWPVPPVIGDRDLLSVAVFNLLSNAVKYSEPGARTAPAPRRGFRPRPVDRPDHPGPPRRHRPDRLRARRRHPDLAPPSGRPGRPARPPLSRVTLGARPALSMFGNSLSSSRCLHDPNANEQPNMLKPPPAPSMTNAPTPKRGSARPVSQRCVTRRRRP